ncbi:MAG: hypothetical protein E5W96_17460 [Mesorhizobium sp.]|nr:MAG: hypothetical protein E5W96_17460 [Mesorhizobium sp.]
MQAQALEILKSCAPCSLQHPSSVSALRADPPSPTRGEGKWRLPYIPFIASQDTFGFMSAKAPVGFCFQAHTCSS